MDTQNPERPSIRPARPTPLVLLLLTLMALSLTSSRAQPAPPLESIAEIRRLTWNELKMERPVRFEGIVYGKVPRTGRLLVQDAGEGVIVIPETINPPPPTGARIRVEGVTAQNATAKVKAKSITILDRRAGAPDSETLSIPEARDAAALTGALVEIRGVVAQVRTNRSKAASIMRNRVTISLRHQGETIKVLAPRPNRNVAAKIRHATIRARGPLMDVRRSPKHEHERILWATEWSMITFEKPGPLDPFSRAKISLDAIRSNAPMDDDRPIRFRGRIRKNLESGRFEIGLSPHPRAASFVAHRTNGRAFEIGEVVDLLGFPVNRADGVQFEVTDFRWLGLPGDAPLPEDGIVQLTNYVGLATTIVHIN